jgi:hypothetical protein
VGPSTSTSTVGGIGSYISAIPTMIGQTAVSLIKYVKF